MRKVKRPCKRISSLYIGNGNNKVVKKPYIKEGRLYLGEGRQKGGSLGLIAAQILPALVGPIAKLFGGKRKSTRIRRNGIKKEEFIKNYSTQK